MSFTFTLNGVTRIVMVRKIPWKTQVAVLIDDVELYYDLQAPGGVSLIAGNHPPPEPALEEKIIQVLKLYFITPAT
ncbi:hypothetical protein DCM91_18720 [Chitinophaga costaii]|nr:hypothetical protein DCM91_18720 [Chitinophaga costaii]